MIRKTQIGHQGGVMLMDGGSKRQANVHLNDQQYPNLYIDHYGAYSHDMTNNLSNLVCSILYWHT